MVRCCARSLITVDLYAALIADNAAWNSRSMLETINCLRCQYEFVNQELWKMMLRSLALQKYKHNGAVYHSSHLVRPSYFAQCSFAFSKISMHFHRLGC